MQREHRMPPDPNDHKTWELAIWIKVNSHWLFGGLVAFFMVLVRAYYDRAKLTRQDFAAAIICGFIVIGLRPLAINYGFNDDFATFIGVMIGILGWRFFRPAAESLARHVLNNRGKK